MLNWLSIQKLARDGNLEPPKKVIKTDEEWKETLDPETYRVTREHGTERAYSSEMCSKFEPGLYACACCGTTLFDANTKFESGTGWPSFTMPVEENRVAYHEDNSYGMHRIEALCNICDAHLGHVFPDGPEPTGLRYCINAVALRKIDQD